MKINYHLDSSELMSCASGSQPEAIAAIISTHLSMCPHCRHELKIHSLIGESLFHTLKDTPLVSPVLSQAPSKSLSLFGFTSEDSVSRKLHDALQNIYSGHLSKVNWVSVAPGLSDFSFPLSKKHNGTLKLVRIDPKISLHHLERTGGQIILVVDGSLSDNSGVKNKGDVVHITPEKAYSLTASDSNGCVCLIGSEKYMDLHKVLN